MRTLPPAVVVAGRPVPHATLADRMAGAHIPGVSIAVVENGRIAWARGFGVQEAGGRDAVTAHTLFQAASISKVIAATMTLRLVDAQKLDLDADVNRALRSWQVPENAFTATQKVTLRRILSHTAGLTVHGFPGYRPDGALPSVLDVLDGRAPATNAPVRVDTVPGSTTRYSGGGIVIEQLLLTDVTGRAFPQLARELVLDPLQMRDSTFEQPLPPPLAARAARGHDEDGGVIPGGWAIGPEMAAGWLWTTAADLMKWAIAIDASRAGTSGAPLSRGLASQMLTPQKDVYGLGPVLEGSGRAFRFSHGGNNPGYTTQFIYFPETHQGAAILVNRVGADQLIDELTRAIAEEYDWPALKPLRVTPATLADAAIANLTGAYALQFPGSDPPSPATIAWKNGRLALDAPPIITDDELIPISATELVSPAWGYRIRVAGRGFTLTYNGTDMTATRVER
ncbi:MAG: beta-lactamase family protein [Acidobacteria bacterium]|nr:beta-lactamase family protein [Acidobacteriota bacterium]MBV9070642.1 beta-lactamase family protein [Acidobacteriota bacterium]